MYNSRRNVCKFEQDDINRIFIFFLILIPSILLIAITLYDRGNIFQLVVVLVAFKVLILIGIALYVAMKRKKIIDENLQRSNSTSLVEII